jgi:hypothetical protein
MKLKDNEVFLCDEDILGRWELPFFDQYGDGLLLPNNLIAYKVRRDNNIELRTFDLFKRTSFTLFSSSFNFPMLGFTSNGADILLRARDKNEEFSTLFIIPTSIKESE